MSKGNAFDGLLASIGEDTDRQALSGLAEKYPTLKESVMLRSDYSRKMDEARAKVELADTWTKWREENWVDDAYGDKGGALKRELAKDARIKELEQLAAGGDMTFEQLNAQLDQYATTKGFVSQDAVKKQIDDRASGVDTKVNQLFAGYAQVATKGPQLAVRHFIRHQEELDLGKLVEFAGENNINSIDEAYNRFAADKDAALAAKKRDEEFARIRAEEREAVTKELAAKNPSAMPVDDGGSDMGHFEKRIRGIKETSDPAVDDMPALGRGGIAHRAARENV